MANTNRLGELLVREKLISLSQLRTAQEEQQKAGGNLGYALAKLGFISDDEITNFLSQQYRVPTIDLTDYEIDAEILKLVAKDQCEKHHVIPVSRTGNSLIVAMADPTNLHAIDDLKFLTGYNIEPVIASETAILQTIEKYLQRRPLVRRGHGRLRRGGDRLLRPTSRTSTCSSSRRRARTRRSCAS